MPDWIPINWKLLANPANWIIVVLMVTIAAFGAAAVAGKTDLFMGDN